MSSTKRTSKLLKFAGGTNTTLATSIVDQHAPYHFFRKAMCFRAITLEAEEGVETLCLPCSGLNASPTCFPGPRTTGFQRFQFDGTKSNTRSSNYECCHPFTTGVVLPPLCALVSCRRPRLWSYALPLCRLSARCSTDLQKNSCWPTPNDHKWTGSPGLECDLKSYMAVTAYAAKKSSKNLILRKH